MARCMLCKEASLQGAILSFAQETGQEEGQGRSGQRGQGDA